ncbi:MAG TPA: hypothetical protein GX743_11285 [Actinomycetales bacterium]|nr:hypothetical protein [Actinomycetales bacterium]
MTRTLPTRSFLVTAAALAAGLVLSGCSGDPGDQPLQSPAGATAAQPNNSDVLKGFGLEAIPAQEVVDQLDRTTLADRDQDLFASVRPDGLLVRGPDGAEETLPLPEDQFYLSFAPYVTQTHDCFYHSLTTCVGELQNQQMDLTITNMADGSTVVDETVSTFDNGFYGLWLPADESFELTVHYGGKTVTAPIGTGPDDPTCVTTLQLS